MILAEKETRKRECLTVLPNLRKSMSDVNMYFIIIKGDALLSEITDIEFEEGNRKYLCEIYTKIERLKK